MLRRFLAALALALAFTATQASAQSLTTYTFATLPGSPTAGQLAWITDNSGTPIVGSPAAGGAGAGNRDLVAYDATQSRWEFVARQPNNGSTSSLQKYMDANRVAYAKTIAGLAVEDVQAAIDAIVGAANGGGVGAVSQANYAVGSSANALEASTTTPANTKFGVGITYGNPSAFSAVPAGEADHMVGFFWNQTGVDGPYVNFCEHAGNESWELAYRATSGTFDHTYLEKNIDVRVPDVTLPLTSAGGTLGSTFLPLVGETVFFSGGGQGKVLAFSNPNLTVRMDYGCVATGETAIDDDGNPAHTVLIGTPVPVDQWVRPFQYEFDTLLNRSFYAWNVLDKDGYATGAIGPYVDPLLGPTLSLSTFLGGQSNARIRPLVSVNAPLIVQEAALWDSPIAKFRYSSAGHNDLDAAVGTADGYGGGSYRIAQWETDWSATNTSFGSPVQAFFAQPTGLAGSSSVFRPFVLYVANQGGQSTTGNSVYYQEPQTCIHANCTADQGLYGNFVIGGGNWNNGHLAFAPTPGQDAYTGGADHLYIDQTKQVIRLTIDDTPDSESEGVAVVTGSNSSIYGPAIWAISNGGTFDTGTEVCAAGGSNSSSTTTGGVGMVCQSVINFGALGVSPTSVACGTTITATQTFIAMCK